MRKKQNEKNKKTKKKTFLFLFFCCNFFVFQPISTFLVSKSHGQQQQPHAANRDRKLRRVRKLWGKNKPKKQKNKKKKTFLFLFFGLTSEPFGVFDRGLLHAVAAITLLLLRPKTIKSVEKQKSYGKKTKFYGLGKFLQVPMLQRKTINFWKKKEVRRNFVFWPNFFVLPGIRTQFAGKLAGIEAQFLKKKKTKKSWKTKKL